MKKRNAEGCFMIDRLRKAKADKVLSHLEYCGGVPEEVKKRIYNEKDVYALDRMSKLASKSISIKNFMDMMEEMEAMEQIGASKREEKDTDDKLVIILNLKRMTVDSLDLEVKECENRAFSSMAQAEEWLRNNGFYLGQRDFLKYDPKDSVEWCRLTDALWEFIDVEIAKYSLDDFSNSCFKEF